MSEEKVEPSNPPRLDTSLSHDGADKKDAGSSGSGEEEASKAKEQPVREATPKDYFRVFTDYARKWDIVLIVVGVVASMGAGITLPLMNVVFGRLVSQFTSFMVPGNLNDASGFQDLVNRQTLYLFLLFLGRFITAYIAKFAFRMIGIRMSSKIRLHYLVRLFGQSIHVLDSMPSGAAASTITTTANTLQLGISEKLGIFVEFLTTIIAAAIISFTWDWRLSLVVCSVILFILLTLSILLPFILKGEGKVTAAKGKAASIANETFASIRIVMACGAESRVAKRYGYWVEQAKRRGLKISPLFSLQFGLVFFALYSAFALGFWYGCKSAVEGRLDDVATIVIVLFSVFIMTMSLERISTPLLAVGKAMVAACEFFTVIDAPQPAKGHLKSPDVNATSDIVFKDVQFAYPSRPHVKVLDGLDLSIQAGKITAIVGPSGSGKSTIVGLIERWYNLKDQYVIAKAIEKEKDKKKKKKNKKDGEEASSDSDQEEKSTAVNEEPTGPAIDLRGNVLTCGHNIDDIDLKWWRTKIGVVQQEPFLFNDSVFHNVAHGLIGSEWENENEERKRELVKEACQESFADEFIDRLPDGYDTMVGDSGTKLSGGQRQRIAIARSIIKKPHILILDEATSAIDVRGERIVQAALDKVSQNRTTITIAHRLSTIKKADRIVVLQKGRVVEQGTHESLLSNEEGAYYGLVYAQKLSLGDAGEADDDDDKIEEEDIGAVLSREKSAAKSDTGATTTDPTQWKEVGLARGFGQLLWEQRRRWPYWALTVIFTAVFATSTPFMAYLFAKVVVVFQYYETDMDKFWKDGKFWSLMWFILALGTGFSYMIVGFVSSHFSHYVASAHRHEYFESILFQKASYFDDEDHSTGTLTSRVATDPTNLEEMMGMNMAIVYSSGFQLIGGVTIAFVFSWKLACLACFVILPVGMAAGYFRFKYEIDFEKLYAQVFAESSKFAAEAIGAFRTVTALTLEDVICERYDELLRRHVNSAFKKAWGTTTIFALSDSVALAYNALVFWYGAKLMMDGDLEVTNFFVCYMAATQAAEAAGQGFSFGPNAASAKAASNRILGARFTRNKDTHADSESIPNAEGGVKIEFQNVHFRYPTRDVSIFKDLNITIEKGQFAALVGASGCGKTSIVSLLERFYDVNKGHILANGIDIHDMNVYSYRTNLSLVAQEPTLFQGTLRENILLGVDPDTVSEEQLHNVCRDASIHEFIVSLPDGYNTDIGSRGVSLSGGQKQRVAIARALVRNPRILLLDEATSSLDSESEKLVQAAFEKAGKGRTMIAVAHRLATVQNADIIFVLGEGKVLEKGSHTELLKQKGVYWHMVSYIAPSLSIHQPSTSVVFMFR
ncbi:P-loop containing nucleoside triphosphate hydrolase protein [Zalerion maritima]|uniref:P-loop containing nucleoside triphosphate hydrolase protein n=1 Tax=Zalerion maritima TaxID=339359 RepID=A0AAD5S6B5_9PEZI|nr:P-loop containing nucleoside triphosphate hydrolase protein [Zalerion maritima]